jgi:hypothetical protein
MEFDASRNVFINDNPDIDVEVVVGDEKVDDAFLPRLKWKRWDNYANFSLGLANTDVTYEYIESENKVVARTNDGLIETYFYEKARIQDKPLINSIRITLNGDEIDAVSATAEYEMFNKIGEPGQMLIAHYVVTEPSIAVFDKLHADTYMDVDENGYVKDFNYDDKSSYHPDDIAIPSYDRLPLVRFYTPYTVNVNPYYMDGGLHNIDLQWHKSVRPFDGLMTDKMVQAVVNVLTSKGITVRSDGGKVYFQHNSRWVKCFSAQEEEGGLYCYFNVDSAYNKAYDFYRPDVEKDIRDQFAYGIKAVAPTIDHSIVGEIITEFCSLLNITPNYVPYSTEETNYWNQLKIYHTEFDWRVACLRKDALWYRDRQHLDGYEMEFKLYDRIKEIPLTTSVPKRCKAFYQAPIQSPERDPIVDGSIAVYAWEDDMLTGGRFEYGKLTHIYRPIAYDASGRATFCSFKECDGLQDGDEIDLTNGLTIVLPDWFLQEAELPIYIDPTFGYTTAGGSNAATSTTILGTIHNLPTFSLTGGTIVTANFLKMFWYMELGNPGKVEGAIYTGSSPYNFIEDTYTQTVGGTQWFVQFLESQPLVGSANTPYTMCVWGSGSGSYGGTQSLRYDSINGRTSLSYSLSYQEDSWPSSLSGATTQSNRAYSVYTQFYVGFTTTEKCFIHTEGQYSTQGCYIEANTTKGSELVFVHGLDTIIVTELSYINGHIDLVSSIDNYINGYDILSSSNLTYINGSENIDVSQNIFINGYTIVISTQSLYIPGHVQAVVTNNNYIGGHENITTFQYLYLSGLDSISVVHISYVHGHIIVSSLQKAHIFGHAVLVSSKPAYILCQAKSLVVTLTVQKRIHTFDSLQRKHSLTGWLKKIDLVVFIKKHLMEK